MTTVSQKQQPTGFCATTPGWCTPQPSAQVFSHRQVDGYLGPKVFTYIVVIFNVFVYFTLKT